MCDLKQYLVGQADDLRTVIALIDRNAQGIALAVDDQRRLLGTVTDGDIRRAMLAGLDLKSPVSELLAQRDQRGRPPPVTAPVGTLPEWLLSVMHTYSLRHIPLLDDRGRVVDLALLSELAGETALPVTAVVMAGGFGKRLRPLTNGVPKPMLPVGDRPLLERIVDNLRLAGIQRVVMTTHYKREMIAGHFGDGAGFGVEITYLEEDLPMGTAGALKRMHATDDPLLVINGDILTAVDFRAMLDFHREHQAHMSVAVRRVENRVPYGVVESDGALVTGIAEKPVFRYLVNAGIYLLDREITSYIPEGEPYQMTQLIARLLAENKRVVGFPIREYWRDIGHLEDYRQAQLDHSERKVS